MMLLSSRSSNRQQGLVGGSPRAKGIGHSPLHGVQGLDTHAPALPASPLCPTHPPTPPAHRCLYLHLHLQVPSSWRPVIEDPPTLQLFLDYYLASTPPLSSVALECMVGVGHGGGCGTWQGAA